MEKIPNEIQLLCAALRIPVFFEVIKQKADKGLFSDAEYLNYIASALRAQNDENSEKKVSRLQKQAGLRWPQATLADFKQKTLPISMAKIQEFARGKWLNDHLHLAITGPTGSGKTHLACAIANELLLNEISVLYYHFHTLLRDLKIAESAGESAFSRLFRKLTRVQVLLVDDWGMQALNVQERRLLFQLIEVRDQNASFIVTSQYDTSDWITLFQDPSTADSIIDRVIHYFLPIDWHGPSYRQIRGNKLVAKNLGTKTQKGDTDANDQ